MPFPPDGPTLPDWRGDLPLRGITVLVVEDSRLACDALRLIFQHTGARLRRADSLAAAARHLARYRPDLVIVDLGLPDGRGEGLVAEASARGLAVLGLSGDPDGRASALEAGAVAFVEKPIAPVAGFLRLVRQLVAGVGPEAPGQEIAPPVPDPVALRDDLARAAALLSAPGGGGGYATGFVRSLARAAGDEALEAAALRATAPPGRDDAGAAARALATLLGDRLARLTPLP